ncbi:hypothetical protein KI387_011814, partial [Taxus chinensis]
MEEEGGAAMTTTVDVGKRMGGGTGIGSKDGMIEKGGIAIGEVIYSIDGVD